MQTEHDTKLDNITHYIIHHSIELLSLEETLQNESDQIWNPLEFQVNAQIRFPRDKGRRIAFIASN